jgi:RNA polymerase sigma-70 factor (ECF subfamily)
MGRIAETVPGGGIETRLEPLRVPLMRFFMRRARDRTEAEDLTQEAFARLLATAERDSVEDPEAFVFQIALNLLRDRGRRAQRRGDAQVALVDPHRVSEVTQEFVEDCTPERVLQGRDDIDCVMKALGELNERTRDIYLLFRLENMKQAQIAELFGIGRSTVEKEVMRATLHLTTRLGRDRG